MGKMIIGGGGISLEDVTGTPGDLIKGKSAYLQGSDEPQAGTLELTGNATAAYVYSGKTFYSMDPKLKLTGSMTVNSLLSFSVAAYSGRRVLAKWQNPKAASGKPYSGVYIRYSTSGNPGKTGGTQIYKGAGNNTASEGQSQAYLDLPALSTKYYLSIYPYVTCSAGEMTGAVINATVTTAAVINKTFTTSGSYTVPTGYTKADLFVVGGGGKAWFGGYGAFGSGGAGGGRTATKTGLAISAGQKATVTIGAGGTTGNSTGPSGGTTSIVFPNYTLQALGGETQSAENTSGGAGGSGGGGASYYRYGHQYDPGGAGGSNGGNGANVNGNYETTLGGKGQGTTTRAWGSSTGTMYAGGGGGSGGCSGSSTTTFSNGGAGGGGGGGRGGNGAGHNRTGEDGVSGSANTGGGGGGGGSGDGGRGEGGNGGSGIALLKLY